MSDKFNLRVDNLVASSPATFQAGTAALPAITTSGDTNTGIFFPAADTIAFAEGGAEAMRIDSSGNLLVGTTTSKAKTTIVGASVVGDYYSFDTTLNQLENFEICRFSLPRSGNLGVNAFSGTLNFNVSLFRGASNNHQNNVSVLAHVFLGGFPLGATSTDLSADIQLISTATNQPETSPGSITIALVAEGSDDAGVNWTTLTNNAGVTASSATGILIRIRANLTGTTPSLFNGNFKCFSSISGACNEDIVLSSTTISII